MGIFGYNAKDYEKNSAEFKNSIARLQRDCGGQMEIGSMLNKVLMEIDKNEYPHKANGKVLQAIDERIRGLISTMQTDIQRKEMAQCSQHAQMLLSAVRDSRKYGKEQSSREELESQEIMAQCLGSLNGFYDEKLDIEQKKKELIKEGQRATSQAVAAKIKLQFDKFSIREREVDGQIVKLTERYNRNLELVQKMKRVEEAARYQKLSVVANPADFSKKVAAMNRIYEQEAMKDSELDDIMAEADEGFYGTNTNKAADSTFYDLVNQQNNEDLANGVRGANVGANAAGEDPMSFFKNMSL